MITKLTELNSRENASKLQNALFNRYNKFLKVKFTSNMIRHIDTDYTYEIICIGKLKASELVRLQSFTDGFVTCLKSY